jgi:hypothetical protein
MENEIMNNNEEIETNEPIVANGEDGSLKSLAMVAGVVATATLVVRHVAVKHIISATKRGGKALAGFVGKLTKKDKVKAPDENMNNEETAE